MQFLSIISEFLDWSIPTFKNATSESSLRKLENEIEEVRKSETKDEKREEYTDCLLCIFDSAKREGITPESLFGSMILKININKSRKWKENPDGTYSHIK